MPAAIVPVWIGSILPRLDDPDFQISWWLLAATLASCLCIQIATNLFNDVIDDAKGADTEKRLGPVRATASGLLSRRTVLLGALGFCLAAAIFGLFLIAARGWIILAIGSVSLLLAFAYTGGPFPLAYRGMGEVFVILFFGFVAVCGSYFVQTGLPPSELVLVISLQIGLYSSVLIAINNLRDIEEDNHSGKRTLAVRFGKRFARWEIAVFCWLPLLLNFAWFPKFPIIFVPLMPALLLPLATMITSRVFAVEPGRNYNKYLAWSALQLLLFAAIFTVGLLIR